MKNSAQFQSALELINAEFTAFSKFHKILIPRNPHNPHKHTNGSGSDGKNNLKYAKRTDNSLNLFTDADLRELERNDNFMKRFT